MHKTKANKPPEKKVGMLTPSQQRIRDFEKQRLQHYPEWMLKPIKEQRASRGVEL